MDQVYISRLIFLINSKLAYPTDSLISLLLYLKIMTISTCLKYNSIFTLPSPNVVLFKYSLCQLRTLSAFSDTQKSLPFDRLISLTTGMVKYLTE